MTSQDEFELMKSDPVALYYYYIDLVFQKIELSEEQIIKYEYCKTVLGL